ncbi:MAG: virulence-associated E family protein, partial [Allobaculum sp.]|nr:virulence-associated E family protein [Allobaculum sp.]
TYSGGSTAGGLVVYGDGSLAYSFHSTDPAGNGHSLNAFDLVRVHLFGELDKDSTGRGNTLPSYREMVKIAQDDTKVKQTRAEEAFSKQLEKIADEEDPKAEDSIDLERYKEENKGWQLKLVRNPKSGKIMETIENVLTILENDTALKTLGGFNEFSRFNEKTGDLPWWKWNSKKIEWEDSDTSELFLYLEKYYGIQKERVVNHGKEIIHKRRAFHPVKNYLDPLKWDGVERLDTLLVDYMGAEDTEYTRAVTRKTLVAAVARIYQPGCKMDYVLTLTGPQGIKKSTFFRTLSPQGDWFSDSLETFQGKEAYEALQGVWIVEIAELSAAKRSDIERTKQFLTKQDDKFREAYARTKGRFRRQCIFVATTNSSDFLRDYTGNRRWWVVPVVGGTQDVMEDLARERDQIWAEAKYRYEQGEKLYLSDEVEKAAREMQSEYTYTSVREGIIADYLDLWVPENWKNLSVEARKDWLDRKDLEGVYQRDQISLLEIWVEALDGSRDKFSNTDQREISDILLKLGWVRDRNPRRVGSDYGKQRVFLRPKD